MQLTLVKRGEEDRVNNCQRVYRYVRYSAGTAANDCHGGATLCYVGNTPYVVTQDVSDTDPNRFAGIATTIMTNNDYGWVQCGGLNASAITDGNVDGAVMASTTDGVLTSMVGTGDNIPVGVSMSADHGTMAEFIQLFDR